MSLRKYGPLWLICFLFMSATGSSKHTVWVIINNASSDRQPVDIKLNIIDQKEVSTVIAEQQIPAGIRQLPEKKYKEGVYQVSAGAGNGQLWFTRPFTLDSERWILINYIREDSANIIKSHGYLDTTVFKKINGLYATLNIYVENRRPAGL